METHRVYEGTFRASDFGEYLVLGGLEFVIKLLQSGFNETDGARVMPSSPTPELLTVAVRYSSPILTKPIRIALDLHSIRRSEAGVEVAIIDKHVKAMEVRIKELESHLSSLKYLEETFGGLVYMPGVNYMLPKNIERITFVSNNTAVPFDLGVPPNIADSCIGRVHTDTGYAFNDYREYGVYSHPCEIHNLKYMASLTSIAFIGDNRREDYSPIQHLSNLTELTICSRLGWTGTSPYPFTLYGNCAIKDISWIKSLKKLKTLRLIGCNQLGDLTSLTCLPNLRVLDVRLSSGMESLGMPASVTVHK